MTHFSKKELARITRGDILARMQTPLVSFDESKTRVQFKWIAALLISGALWIGCGGSPESGGDSNGDGNSSKKGGQPTQTAKQNGENNGGGNNNKPAAKPIELPKTEPKAPEPKLPLPASAKHLPAKSAVLLSIKAGNLMKKGDYAELLKSPIFAELMNEIQDEFVQGLIADPAKAGLDVDQPLMIFADFKPPAEDAIDPLVEGGLVASIKDGAKLKALLDMLIANIDLPGVNLQPVAKEGYTAIAPPGLPAALGYSKDTLVILITNNPEDAPAIPGKLDNLFKAKGTLDKTSNAARLLQRPHDAAVWLDYGKVLNTMLAGLGELAEEANPFGALTPKMMENIEISATVRFEAGSVAVSMGSTYNEELYKGEFSKGGLDKKLLGMVPGNAIVAGAQAFSMKPIRNFVIKEMLPMLKNGENAEMVQQAENMMGLTIEDVLMVPKGDFLLVFDGVVQPDKFETPMPQFLIGMSIENKANLQKLLDNPAVAGALVSLNALGMQLTHNENGFFFYSANHAQAVNTGQQPNLAAPARLALLSGDLGGYVKFGAVVQLLTQLPATAEDPDIQEIVKILGKLDAATVTGSYGKGTQTIDAKLTFADKQANGLKQLVDFIKAMDIGFNDADAAIGQTAPAPEVIEVDPVPAGKEDK